MAETEENQIIAPEAPAPEEAAPTAEAPAPEDAAPTVEAPAPEEVAPAVEVPAPETVIPVQLLRLVPTVGEPDMNDTRLDGAAIVEAALARQAADEA
ncbi:hypothetical protein V5F79_03275 [Xanthobacter flavus]|uniref:hypothetical protein n=1 Tax=Xanthobacter flavus TaxID=281 RepID=UPI00372B51A2